MVPRRHRPGRPRRDGGRREGLHGDQATRLRDLGGDATGPRQALQGDGAQERRIPAAHPDELHQQGSRARRGLCARTRCRHAGRRQGTRRAVRDPADVRDDHRPLLREVDRLTPRPTAPDQPVGERDALGASHALVPAHGRVLLARGPHSSRNARRSEGRSRAHARRVPRLRTRGDGDAGRARHQERQRALRGRTRDVDDRKG